MGAEVIIQNGLSWDLDLLWDVDLQDLDLSWDLDLWDLDLSGFAVGQYGL